ncbi:MULTISPECIES: hypothetical protein [Mycolicibacter]|uniref:Uncharacterized protein n=2 Tax=Mycolicibacter TaxID=1073531 RepID=A0ABU5XMR2_9MYCO|nr:MULTISPECIES: hypothetical protein [unclassified Mycolicibacter]MEB3023052.1 hypothetical protein [Mycolicibacter sp. MYC098]MEB3033562.1 hypothetical protein [Mycolicibacter sp. MYC340]
MAEVREIADPYGYGRRVKAWDCSGCGTEIQHYPGEREVSCPNCSAQYNPFGQRLRDDWDSNRSNYDDEVGDMEGYEDSVAGDG